MQPPLSKSWDVFIGSSPHPWTPSLREILGTRFSDDERQFFEMQIRPQVESGTFVSTGRVTYIIAKKPLD